MIFSIVMN